MSLLSLWTISSQAADTEHGADVSYNSHHTMCVSMAFRHNIILPDCVPEPTPIEYVAMRLRVIGDALDRQYQGELLRQRQRQQEQQELRMQRIMKIVTIGGLALVLYTLMD